MCVRVKHYFSSFFIKFLRLFGPDLKVRFNKVIFNLGNVVNEGSCTLFFIS